MLKICLVFWESEPQYAYKGYAYKKKTCMLIKKTMYFSLHSNIGYLHPSDTFAALCLSSRQMRQKTIAKVLSGLSICL